MTKRKKARQRTMAEDDDSDDISLGDSSDGDDNQDSVPDELCNICGTYTNDGTQEVAECGCCFHTRCWEKWMDVFWDCPVCTIVKFNGEYKANDMFFCPVKNCGYKKKHCEWKTHMIEDHQVFRCRRCGKNYMKQNKTVHKRMDCMNKNTQVRCPADGCGEPLSKELADMACEDPSILVELHDCTHVFPCSSCDKVFLDQSSLIVHYTRDTCNGSGRKRKRRAAVSATLKIDETKKRERSGEFGKNNTATTVGRKFFEDVMNGAGGENEEEER